MFYLQLLMNKRGPLAHIWLAAHWDKKVTKAHIFECNLETTIEKLLSPKFKMALRTSGHLLLGVVRIYHRKTKYLLADCSEALLKMQTAFRPGLVDLPNGGFEANYEAITLPEEFHDFDVQLPEVNAIDVAEHFTLNQSRAEDITLLEEDCRHHVLLHGDTFGEEIEIPRQHSFFNDSVLASSGSFPANYSFLSFAGSTDDAYALKGDGFGDEGVAGDMIGDVLGSDQVNLITDLDMEGEGEIPLPPPPSDYAILDYPLAKPQAKSCQTDETILLDNVEQGFVLEPIDDSVLKRKQKSKRKRKLLIDAVKELSRVHMQKQLVNFEDTVTTLSIAPPTRKLMIFQEMGSVDKLMNRPVQPLLNEDLLVLFTRCLQNQRGKMQEELEVEKRRELPMATGPSVPQETVHIESQTLLHNGRDEASVISEPVNMVSALSDGSLFDSPPMRLQPESEESVVENGLQGSDLDNEEKRRSKGMLELINTFRRMDQSGAKSFSFLALCKDRNTKNAAAKFHCLLVLKKQLAVEVSQTAPYADIVVTMGPEFYTI